MRKDNFTIKNLLLIALLITALFAEGQSNNFFTFLGGEYIVSINTTKDSGYITTSLTGYNPNGSNFIVSKLDKNGSIQWQLINNQFTGSDGDNSLQRIIEDYQGNYVGVGEIYYSQVGSNSLIVKINHNGDTLWKKQYDFAEGDGLGRIFLNPDSTFIVTGGGGNYDTTINKYFFFSYLLKIDSDGDTLMMKKYGSDTSYNFQITNLLSFHDSVYLFGNSFFPNGPRVSTIYSLDSNYNLISKRLLLDTANLYYPIDNYSSDSTFLTYNTYRNSSGSFYNKVDCYDLTGNRLHTFTNLSGYGCIGSDSTILGVVQLNSVNYMGEYNFGSNSVNPYCTYNFSSFNHLTLDFATTDISKNVIWGGRVDATGGGDISFIARYSDTLQLAIREFMHSKDLLTFYPNPAQSEIYILNPFINKNISQVDLFIYDLTGKIFINKIFDSNTIIRLPLKDLSRGFYILKICSDEECYMKKLIKN